jgi:hypothetical protein
MRMRFPPFKPINISKSRNARNKASLRSSTLRNALDSQAIGQSESRSIRLGQNVDGSGWGHSTRGRQKCHDLYKAAAMR